MPPGLGFGGDAGAQHLDAAPIPYDGMAPAIRLGMPQLDRDGLSETWLLKDIGHRHWMMLAHALGQSRPVFADAHGAELHPAFSAVTLRQGNLGAARANAVLHVASDLTRLSNTQFSSRHRLSMAGLMLGEVEVISTFVKRKHPGANRSAVTAAPAGLPPLAGRPPPTGFAAEASDLRAGRWTSHFGFQREDAPARPKAELVIDPCPSQDFNGVGFLYCAMFQSFVDRAEWAFFRIADRRISTRRRDILYLGNIDPGDCIVITLMAVARSGRSLTHWCRLSRQSGGETLADIFTDREMIAV